LRAPDATHRLAAGPAREARRTHPFLIHGWVVLSDHLHCVIELPPGDADCAS